MNTVGHAPAGTHLENGFYVPKRGMLRRLKVNSRISDTIVPTIFICSRWMHIFFMFLSITVVIVIKTNLKTPNVC